MLIKCKKYYKNLPGTILKICSQIYAPGKFEYSNIYIYIYIYVCVCVCVCVVCVCVCVCVLTKGRPFTATPGTKAAILPKGRSSMANSGNQVAVLLGMNRCGSFPLLSAPHSLFSIWTNFKRSEKIQGAPTWLINRYDLFIMT